MGIFSAINIVGSVTKALAGAYSDTLNAKNQTEKTNAEQRVELLKAQRDVLVEEANNKLTSWIRPAYAAIFWVYLAKILIWDKVLGLGVTESLGPMLTEIMMVIIGFYFLARPFEKIWKRK